MLLATLAGCEMGLRLAGVPLKESGLPAAMEWLSQPTKASGLKAAA
jgi:alanine-glyoxylate transaminase/serine-glyoxylate transaminase/serine-pyruvate transaminase